MSVCELRPRWTISFVPLNSPLRWFHLGVGEDLKRKVDLLPKAGRFAVWVIYLEERTVLVHCPNGTAYTPNKLTAPEILEGWEAPVSSLRRLIVCRYRIQKTNPCPCGHS